MPREKHDVKELRKRAINSLVLAIELFNRPAENARTEGTLILLHHSFEMLLKAIIKEKTGTIHAKDKKCSYSFSKCLELTNNALSIISKNERATLSILDAYRDTSVHYYQYLSEDLLYLQAQAAVTLFDDILSRVFGTKLIEFIPERILPISARPPKDIQFLIDDELSQIDNLLNAGQRKDIQAAARLRSMMALATASRENAERVTELELRKAIRRRKKGEEWKHIFPEIAQLRLDTEGDGIPISLRIRKEGFPVRLAEPGETATIVRSVDWFDKYNLDYSDLCKKLNITGPKMRAYMYEINGWNDPEMFGEKRVKSVKHRRYTQKCLNALREVKTQIPESEIWEKHKDKVLSKNAR